MQIQNEQPAVETQPVPEVQPAVETQPAATVYETYPTADAPKEEPVSKREAKKRVKAEKKAEKKAQKKAAKANAKKGGAGKKFLLAISLGLCFGLFAGAGFYGMRLASLEYARQESKEELADWKDTLEEVYEKVEKFLRSGKVDGNGNLQIQYSSEDVSDVVEDVMPAMVSITNNYTLVGTGFWGQQIQQKFNGFPEVLDSDFRIDLIYNLFFLRKSFATQHDKLPFHLLVRRDRLAVVVELA
jgi:K+-sensing histidine kinase KdpD